MQTGVEDARGGTESFLPQNNKMKCMMECCGLLSFAIRNWVIQLHDIDIRTRILQALPVFKNPLNSNCFIHSLSKVLIQT